MLQDDLWTSVTTSRVIEVKTEKEERWEQRFNLIVFGSLLAFEWSCMVIASVQILWGILYKGTSVKEYLFLLLLTPLFLGALELSVPCAFMTLRALRYFAGQEFELEWMLDERK